MAAASRQVALLRAVNLVRRNRIAMGDLRDLIHGLGYERARTLLQSGNVVYDSQDTPEKASERIRVALARELGLDVGVLVRTQADLKKIVAHNPLAGEATDPKRYMVTFLSDKPPAGLVGEVDASQYEPERFAVNGREIYTWFPDGVQGARLTHAFWERRLKLTATARNWNTVEKLLAMAGGDDG
jgi:uncharacterized protein (DUF1697 family)